MVQYASFIIFCLQLKKGCRKWYQHQKVCYIGFTARSYGALQIKGWFTVISIKMLWVVNLGHFFFVNLKFILTVLLFSVIGHETNSVDEIFIHKLVFFTHCINHTNKLSYLNKCFITVYYWGKFLLHLLVTITVIQKTITDSWILVVYYDFWLTFCL